MVDNTPENGTVIDGGDGFDTLHVDGSGNLNVAYFRMMRSIEALTYALDINWFITLTSGNDTINLSGIRVQASNTIRAGAGNDVILGGNGENLAIFSEAGNDTVTTGLGNYFVNSGSGDDIIVVKAKGQEIYADSGNDRIVLSATSGASSVQIVTGRFDGAAGYDRVVFERATVLLSNATFASIELFDGPSNRLTFLGSSGRDVVNLTQMFGSSSFADQLGYSAGAGNDTVVGSRNAQFLSGGDGDDRIIVASVALNASAIDGGTGNDSLQITGAASVSLGALSRVQGVELITLTVRAPSFWGRRPLNP